MGVLLDLIKVFYQSYQAYKKVGNQFCLYMD